MADIGSHQSQTAGMCGNLHCPAGTSLHETEGLEMVMLPAGEQLESS